MLVKLDVTSYYTNYIPHYYNILQLIPVTTTNSIAFKKFYSYNIIKILLKNQVTNLSKDRNFDTNLKHKFLSLKNMFLKLSKLCLKFSKSIFFKRPLLDPRNNICEECHR